MCNKIFEKKIKFDDKLRKLTTQTFFSEIAFVKFKVCKPARVFLQACKSGNCSSLSV